MKSRRGGMGAMGDRPEKFFYGLARVEVGTLRRDLL